MFICQYLNSFPLNYLKSPNFLTLHSRFKLTAGACHRSPTYRAVFLVFPLVFDYFDAFFFGNVNSEANIFYPKNMHEVPAPRGRSSVASPKSNTVYAIDLAYILAIPYYLFLDNFELSIICEHSSLCSRLSKAILSIPYQFFALLLCSTVAGEDHERRYK